MDDVGSESYSGRLLPNPIERWDLGKIKKLDLIKS